MNRFPWRLVALDLDGTLTRVHGWKFIADRLGRSGEYAATQAQYRSGSIGEDEHLANLLRVARGVPVVRLLEFVAETPKIADIGPSVEQLQALGARVVLLTHNPPYVCEWYLRQYHLDGYGGSSSAPPVGGIIDDPVPVHADKSAALARMLHASGTPAELAVHVGDGPADAEIFRFVGGSVALNAERPEVSRAADASLRADSLLALLPVLERLRPHPPRAPLPSAL